MTSNDNFVTIELFNSGLESVRAEIRGGNKQLRAELKDTRTELGTEIRFNRQDAEHIQTSVYWGFAILAVVVALVGFVITLAPIFKEMYKDAKEYRRRENIREVAREVMREEVRAEVLKAMGKSTQ